MQQTVNNVDRSPFDQINDPFRLQSRRERKKWQIRTAQGRNNNNLKTIGLN